MKATLFGLLFILVVLCGGYIGLKYYYHPGNGQRINQTPVMTRTGILQKSAISQSDFTHVIIRAGGSVGVASYTENLDTYIGKNVSVTGKFSGDTLYVDTITVVP